MTKQSYNRVQLLYNAEHNPYLYGIVHRVHGDVNNHWLENPFVVSKKRRDGEEVVYGTIRRLLEKIVFQTDKLERFQLEAQAKLDSAGIAPLSRENPQLPESEVTDRILDDQDALIEDVLVTTSVDIRILAEIFPQRLKKARVTVYDYDDQRISQIELAKIAGLLVHNRYICIRDEFVVDLFSDESFMDIKPQIGLKINFLEYIAEVEKVIYGLTVKDLVSKLWGMTTKLSASSNIRDIIYLHQNLYTLGGLVVENGKPINTGPLKTVLDRAVSRHLEEKYPKGSRPDGFQLLFSVIFSTPRFRWAPDLDQKQICISVQVNGAPEELVMGYEEFFSELLKSYGNTKLYPRPVG
ncbi:MAG: hypothetical protein OXI24_17765 [Candidatus Poribacteria bacterium]|nr:hypothetical protein [Candidatus Poribacteria bacterium]